MPEERCTGARGITHLPFQARCHNAAPVQGLLTACAWDFMHTPASAWIHMETGRLDWKTGELHSFLMLHPKHSEVRLDSLLLPIAHCTHTAAPTGHIHSAGSHPQRVTPSHRAGKSYLPRGCSEEAEIPGTSYVPDFKIISS